MPRLIDLPGYRRFWSASAISIFGSYLTLLALQVMVLQLLSGSAFDLGVINAARWLPYLLFGVLAGVFIDRWRRKPVLVGADFGRAAVLCLIPVLFWADTLTVPLLAVLMVILGCMSLLFDGANQSYLPRLVPGRLLAPANARVEQTDAVAQSTGPLLAGALIRAVGVPVTFLLDALSYVVSGLIVLSIKTPEQRPPARRRNLKTELRAGLAWVYRHRTLAPMAWSTHIWFLFMSLLSTAFPAFLLADDGFALDALGLGLVYGFGGLGAVTGGALSGRAGRRFDVGRTLVTTRLAMPLPWVLVPLAGDGAAGLTVIAASQFLFWVAMGIEGPNESAYRTLVTPDELRGRMNTTIRSMNRAAVVLGAPMGGFVADAVGFRQAIWIGVLGFAAAGLALAASAFRHASYDEVAD